MRSNTSISSTTQSQVSNKPDTFEILQRIATFSAQVRGHHLEVWRRDLHSATAACAMCGRTVTVYASLFQPEMDGAALDAECDAVASKVA